MFKNRCYNGGNRHQFEAVYAEQPSPEFGQFTKIKGYNVSGVKALMYHNAYLGHVCKWCGKVVKIEEGSK